MQHFYIQNDGILFGIQQGGINKISFDGQALFKKPLIRKQITKRLKLQQGFIIILLHTQKQTIQLRVLLLHYILSNKPLMTLVDNDRASGKCRMFQDKNPSRLHYSNK